jgi:polysaccharide pyruvyl transferase WcaK-like protein
VKTYLVGSFGQQNGGDDAFVEVALWGLERFCSPGTVVLSAPEPVQTSRGLIPATVTRRRFKGQHRIQRYLNTRNLDRVLYAGGGIHSFAAELDAQARVLDRNPAARSAAVGVSVWPFKDAQSVDAFKRFVEHFAFLGVRGRASYERLKAIDAQVRFELTFDIAVSLLDMLGPPVRSLVGQRIVGVSLLSQAPTYHPGLDPAALRAVDERRVELVAGMLNAAIASGACDAIHMLDFCSHERFGDYAIHEQLAARLVKGFPVVHEPYAGDPLSLFRQVSRLQCMIAMRLHAAVFAFSAQVPFLMLPYQDKSYEWADIVGLPVSDRIEPGTEVGPHAERLRDLLASEVPNAALPVGEALKAARRNWEALAAIGF